MWITRKFLLTQHYHNSSHWQNNYFHIPFNCVDMVTLCLLDCWSKTFISYLTAFLVIIKQMDLDGSMGLVRLTIRIIILWSVINDPQLIINNQRYTIKDQWSMINDQQSMIKDPWSMIHDQWFTINDCRSVIHY